MVPVRAEIHDFTRKLVAISSAVMVLGLSIGWWLSGRALRAIAEISATAARIAEGNLAERIGTRETESELGQLSTVLDHTFQRLDHAFAEQARFTSDAAHELRTTIETCQRAARRMNSLIESLLDAEREESKLRACDLAAICRDHLAMMQPSADEKGIVLKTDFTAAPCLADPERLSQVLDNLVGNALKISPPSTCRICSSGSIGQTFRATAPPAVPDWVSPFAKASPTPITARSLQKANGEKAAHLPSDSAFTVA